MGRFLRPDWSKNPEAIPYSNLSDPQSFNLYSYVSNNPFSRADVDGHFWKELWNWFQTGCGCWTHDLDTARLIAQVNSNSDYMATEARLGHGSPTVIVDQVYWFGPAGLAAAAGEEGAAAGGEAAVMGGTEAAETGSGWVRVGRWMSREELEKMQDTGFAQESYVGGSKVAEPADINTYKVAPKGDVYVEYDIPAGSTVPGGAPGVSKIPGPNSTEGRLATSKGLPAPEMPPVRNIQVIDSK